MICIIPRRDVPVNEAGYMSKRHDSLLLKQSI